MSYYFSSENQLRQKNLLPLTSYMWTILDRDSTMWCSVVLWFGKLLITSVQLWCKKTLQSFLKHCPVKFLSTTKYDKLQSAQRMCFWKNNWDERNRFTTSEKLYEEAFYIQQQKKKNHSEAVEMHQNEVEWVVHCEVCISFKISVTTLFRIDVLWMNAKCLCSHLNQP